jgi:Rps23 Pro-64 3,4-dihydroxylase Tpa1-like proline 4-hydroxylase
MIVNEMNRYVQLPRTTRWTAQYCRWGRDTGINPHSDERYLLGATLYLNETWQQEWGGLFMCKDTVVPQYNLLVINDRQENHCVSRIKPQAPYERITLQIWAQGR